MTFSLRPSSSRSRLAMLTLAPILPLFALVILVPPDGLERAEWAQFMGRFHPLLIHFPIALILVVPVLELAAKSRHLTDLGSSVDFVLALATLSATVASTLGWCLARSGGSSGSLVTQHMWGGVLLTIACWLCWMLRGRSNGESVDLIYALALVAAVGLVSWTGYRGGQLSQGENHLTEYMPTALRGLLGISAREIAHTVSANLGPATLYGARIQPVFVGHCTTCHGPAKHKANLRLDSYEAAMRGGKHGRVIKAGAPESSELFRRITLPPTDDHFMPAENKRPLSAIEIRLIELWISAGASGTLLAGVFKDLPADSASAAVADITFEEIDAAAVAKQRATLSPAFAQLQKRFPDTFGYESRGSADLVVNMSLLGSKFGDEDLAALEPLAEHIVTADFSYTAITDRSAAAIASMKRLRVLRLMRTKVTDVSLQAIGALDQLESLSVFGTSVTPAALPVVEHMRKLQHIYAGETRITAEAPMPASVKSKFLF